LIATAMPLKGSKTNFRMIIFTHSSINPANITKIGPADFEKIGLKKSLKIRNGSKTYKTSTLYSNAALIQTLRLVHST